MKDNIGEMVAGAVGGLVPLYLAEAEVNEYPYAVYFYTPEAFETKDGPYKIQADVTVQVYSPDHDEASGIAEAAMDAMLEGLNSGVVSCRASKGRQACVEGIWNIEHTYVIRQFI